MTWTLQLNGHLEGETDPQKVHDYEQKVLEEVKKFARKTDGLVYGTFSGTHVSESNLHLLGENLEDIPSEHRDRR